MTEVNLPDIPEIETIKNARPHMQMTVEHILYLPELCPATQNPRQGSRLILSYQAPERLLELFSLDRHIQAYVAHPVVRDMEYFTQVIAQNAADAVQTTVTARAEVEYNRIAQGQHITVIATPQTREGD